VRGDQGDVAAAVAVLKGSLNESAAFAVSTAATGLKISNSTGESTVASVGATGGECLTVLSLQSRSAVSTVVGEGDGVRFGIDLHKGKGNSEESGRELGEHRDELLVGK